jgi:hypothetical protein
LDDDYFEENKIYFPPLLRHCIQLFQRREKSTLHLRPLVEACKSCSNIRELTFHDCHNPSVRELFFHFGFKRLDLDGKTLYEMVGETVVETPYDPSDDYTPKYLFRQYADLLPGYAYSPARYEPPRAEPSVEEYHDSDLWVSLEEEKEEPEDSPSCLVTAPDLCQSSRVATASVPDLCPSGR